MKNNMVKRIAGIAICVMAFACMTACGKKEAEVADTAVEEDAEATEETSEATEEATQEGEYGEGDADIVYPQNFMEERAQQYEFDSYDEIIALLENGEAYGYAKVMGADEDILFITEETFDGYGAPASICVFPYAKDERGKYVCTGVISSDSTATPISVTPDGIIICATHTSCELDVIAEDTKGMMALEYVYLSWNDDGTTATYGGFKRDTNNAFAETVDFAEDDSKAFEDAFALLDTAKMIEFTVVSK